MKKRIEFIKIDENGKNIMVNIKKKTGIDNWNVLCRYALLLSLKNRSLIYQFEKEQASSIIMEWKTFSGKYNSILEAIVKFKFSEEMRNKAEHLQETHEKYVNAHINRGIKIMRKTRDIKEIIKMIKKLSY